VRTQEAPDIVETSSKLKAKLFWKILWALNLVLFQKLMMPPENRSEGTYSKLSYVGGQKFFIYGRSSSSLFVSCKQMISQDVSWILLLMAVHLLTELIPFTFQQRSFQFLFLCLLIVLIVSIYRELVGEVRYYMSSI
jgi:hypothetical protein